MSDQNLDHIIYIECFIQLGMSTSQIFAVFSEVCGAKVRRNQFSSGINCWEGGQENTEDVERSCYPKTHVFDEFVDDIPDHVYSHKAKELASLII